MKKIILTLLSSVLWIMIANASIFEIPVVDTLPKRVINGLEVVPIRTTYKSGNILWRLRVPDFEKNFKNFESRYPGGFNHNLISKKTIEAFYNWQDSIWNKVVPTEIKTLPDKFPNTGFDLDILLYINKEGHVFTVEFFMTNDVFQELNTLPQNMIKDLYHNLLKKKFHPIKQVTFRFLDMENEFDRACSWQACGSGGQGKEYVTVTLKWMMYKIFGTQNNIKIQKMSWEELGKFFETEN